MLTRVYVNNFKCLVNFELKLSPLNLLLGTNGSGKSTLFDALRRVRIFALSGLKASQVFFLEDSTKWQSSDIQSFELEFEQGSDTYRYELAIQFAMNNEPSVAHERLWCNGSPLLRHEHGEVQLYHDDFTPDVSYPIAAAQSLLTLVPVQKDNQKLYRFKQLLDKLMVVQIFPPLIKRTPSDSEDTWLNPDSANFVSWYRHLSLNQGLISELTNELKEVIEGFSHFSFRSLGQDRRALIVHLLADHRKTTEYWFHELSDGQCALIVLYTLLLAARYEGYILCVDEPENFLALTEIQPWLTTLSDQCNEEGS